MKFAAALFDLDGTLQDSEIHWIYATRDFLRDNGAECTDEDAINLVYGRSSTDIYNDIAAMPQFKGRTIADLAEAIRKYYGYRLETEDIAYPTSVALLKQMAKDMPVAIVSGSPREDVIDAARRLGVKDDLSLILGAEDAVNGKPDPECFLTAARILGVDPAKCIVLEDSNAGVLAAKAGGMFCVAISREGRPVQDVSAADIVVSDLGEYKYEA